MSTEHINRRHITPDMSPEECRQAFACLQRIAANTARAQKREDKQRMVSAREKLETQYGITSQRLRRITHNQPGSSQLLLAILTQALEHGSPEAENTILQNPEEFWRKHSRRNKEKTTPLS